MEYTTRKTRARRFAGFGVIPAALLAFIYATGAYAQVPIIAGEFATTVSTNLGYVGLGQDLTIDPVYLPEAAITTTPFTYKLTDGRLPADLEMRLTYTGTAPHFKAAGLLRGTVSVYAEPGEYPFEITISVDYKDNGTNATVTLSRWFVLTVVSQAYKVTLERNWGVGGPASVSAAYGFLLPEGQIAPVRSGYAFAGYFEQNGGIGTQYYSVAMEPMAAWDVSGNGTIYAYWVPEGYTELRFNNGDASGGQTANVMAQYGMPLPELSVLPPTRPEQLVGYGFIGYWDEEGAGTMYYGPDMTAAQPSWMRTDPIVELYARWGIAPISGGAFGGFDGGSTNDLGTVIRDQPVQFDLGGAEAAGAEITYAITDGALPDGLYLDPVTGEVLGTVSGDAAAGAYTFEVTATASNGADPAAKSFSITVADTLTLVDSIPAGETDVLIGTFIPPYGSGVALPEPDLTNCTVTVLIEGNGLPSGGATLAGHMDEDGNVYLDGTLVDGPPLPCGDYTVTVIVDAQDCLGETYEASGPLSIYDPAPGGDGSAYISAIRVVAEAGTGAKMIEIETEDCGNPAKEYALFGHHEEISRNLGSGSLNAEVVPAGRQFGNAATGHLLFRFPKPGYDHFFFHVRQID
ncbi:MAG: putative Ig domain-containing protein [Kiritimatiellaeota bacterium]|nr:putative Ig domain-containing protein [Kiritimatiellota bacterium]